ncbi:S41 family peptidase [Acidobacteria bacterium AH-259-O06]|nr:S41 family peptidase [Acidobacteria bacterium AH-259-O06]
MTDGRVGYLHFPGGFSSAYEFIKYFYGQIRKEGLIVDGRNNGGGPHEMWIERLRRALFRVNFKRTGVTPPTVFHGYMVCLVNEYAGSGGDYFAYRFRESASVPVIGKRTAGAGGGGRYSPLIDGGRVRVPLGGGTDTEGNWGIEGHGVDPDIEVENTPRSLIEGHDLQLERAVEEVMKMIRANPKRLPSRPPDPVKRK